MHRYHYSDFNLAAIKKAALEKKKKKWIAFQIMHILGG